MPLEYVENDLAAGNLIKLNITNISPDWAVMPMYVVWHVARPPVSLVAGCSKNYAYEFRYRAQVTVLPIT